MASDGRSSQAPSAFNEEVVAHLDHLYRVAFHLVRNPDEAQDCVQETCLRAFNSHEQFSQGTNLKAWLTRILYNFFFDSYHRSKRLVLVEDKLERGDDTSDYWEKVPANDPGPETRVLQREMSGKISEALRKIPEEFRTPIVLVDMGDLSYAEVAEILSCPVGTVRSRLSRGRRLLHKQLQLYVAPNWEMSKR